MRFLLALLLVPHLASATLTVDPGIVRVSAGSATVQVPVNITGGDLVSDMAGLVETGSPPAAGPSITAVSYTGSIWNNAGGGFASFYTSAPPGATVGPNVSLNTAGQTVAATGLLFTLTVNIAGLPPGDYPIRFTNTLGGDTIFARSGNVVPANYGNGIIRIVDDQLQSWQLSNFPGSAPNPATEAAVWGDLADPDRDGMVNLTEFYLGTNPNVPSAVQASAGAPGMPSFSLTTVASQRYPTLSYTRRILASPVTAELQSSTNLSVWASATTVDVAAPVALPGGELEFVVRRIRTPVGPGAVRDFLRLKVIHP